MYVGISFIKATETMNIKAFGRKTHIKKCIFEHVCTTVCKIQLCSCKKINTNVCHCLTLRRQHTEYFSMLRSSAPSRRLSLHLHFRPLHNVLSGLWQPQRALYKKTRFHRITATETGLKL